MNSFLLFNVTAVNQPLFVGEGGVIQLPCEYEGRSDQVELGGKCVVLVSSLQMLFLDQLPIAVVKLFNAHMSVTWFDVHTVAKMKIHSGLGFSLLSFLRPLSSPPSPRFSVPSYHRLLLTSLTYLAILSSLVSLPLSISLFLPPFGPTLPRLSLLAHTLPHLSLYFPLPSQVI